MATEITMPKLSDTMTEGRLGAWKKGVGEADQQGDVIAEVETDKAVMDLEAFASGILLEQRITARYHLGPLSDDEVANYVSHRLSVGGRSAELFQTSALRKLFRLTDGIPRLINVVCDRALLGAYVQGKDRVDTATLTKAAGEVFGKTKRSLSNPPFESPVL